MADKTLGHYRLHRSHIGLGDAERNRRQAESGAATGHLKSQVVKRSIVIAGHKTSISLEDLFWHELRKIARDRGVHLSELVTTIDSERQYSNLSSAIRQFVFEHLRNRCANLDGRERTACNSSMVGCKR